MQIKPFFVIFPVIVGVAIYASHVSDKKPNEAKNLTPKEYIELVERNKAKRQADEQKAKQEPSQSQQQTKAANQ